MKTKQFICIQCGKEFEKKQGREYKFCNYDCYWKHKKGQKIEHLKDIQFKKGNKINVGRKRPDLTLRNILNNPMKNKDNQKKSSKSHTIHGKNIGRTKALRYKEKVCESCGSKMEVQVHHIDKNRENNNIDNLLVVCRKCHLKIHKRLKELENGSKLSRICKKQIQRNS